MRSPCTTTREWPLLTASRESPRAQQRRPSTAEKKSQWHLTLTLNMLFMSLDTGWRVLLQVVSQLTSPCVMKEAVGTTVKFLFQQLQECKKDKHSHINTPQASSPHCICCHPIGQSRSPGQAQCHVVRKETHVALARV